jgi:hypothetical protein
MAAISDRPSMPFLVSSSTDVAVCRLDTRGCVVGRHCLAGAY